MEVFAEKQSAAPLVGRWRSEWARAYRTAPELLAAGLVDEAEAQTLPPVLAKYRFVLPRYYANLIDRADPACPIRRQAIPSAAELVDRADLMPDPLADLQHQPAPRITHRYQGRALIHVTPNCSMYCRYCFRKDLLNDLVDELFAGSLEEPLAYVARTPELEEIILSGGDPLLVGDDALAQILERLAAIPHVRRLRIHTRVPATFPQRLDAGLVRALGAWPRTLVVATHFNHPRELTDGAAAGLSQLRSTGALLLNQSVLLRGVNDAVAPLADLSRGLVENGVLPYYLHHPDRAAGTGHFDLAREEGIRIHRQLAASVSGYLVPRYVVDLVGEPAKRPVAER